MKFKTGAGAYILIGNGKVLDLMQKQIQTKGHNLKV